ncbi:hypothetical protein BKI51_07230 [Alphaproteobacteria bacterium AO1-B]|nr:hypothetical protein BKI51_07230 [Alphaproteobacteria bacterium AO1-B]
MYVKWAVFALVLSSFSASASTDVQTRGNCSPAVVENAGNIQVSCFINEVPLDSIVRQGRISDLLKAMDAGVSVDTVLQGFVLGNRRNLSGVQFFSNADIKQLEHFIKYVAARKNLNARIYLGTDAYTNLFHLAARSRRRDAILTLVNTGASIHSLENLTGEDRTRFVGREMFPIVTLMREGAISIRDTEAIEALVSSSFLLPEFNVKQEDGRTQMPIGNSSREFSELAKLRTDVFKKIGAASTRQPYDMGNIQKLCEAASVSDRFDWCERLRQVSNLYLLSEENSKTHWPVSISILGLMDIRPDHAIFLMHHTRGWGSVGFLFVPRVGGQYIYGTWNTSGSNATACWSDITDGFNINCWRFYALQEDLLENGKLSGRNGYPVFFAQDSKLDW